MGGPLLPLAVQIPDLDVLSRGVAADCERQLRSGYGSTITVVPSLTFS